MAGLLLFGFPAGAQVAGAAPFDVSDTKGHEGDRVLFSKWNSFSRVAVYDRPHGDWSLSPRFSGARGESLFMDIDSAASTPILKGTATLDDAAYLRYELTALGLSLRRASRQASRALVIGPGGGRDLLSALVFGATHVDGVEINPIIARDVMLDRFREYSGGIYAHPKRRDPRGRRPELRPPKRVEIRRDPGVARGHLGGDGRRRVHAHRELALHTEAFGEYSTI